MTLKSCLCSDNNIVDIAGYNVKLLLGRRCSLPALPPELVFHYIS